MSSAALSQPTDFRQDREDEYLRIIGKYNKEEQERFPRMLYELVEAFEEEKYADILGDLYMQLGMGDRWKGQFFTPYHICVVMAKMSADNIQAEIEQKGYLSVTDPCCGGGALLIAFAQHCREENVDYHNNVVFVAQDIDPVVARMCFIQLSLLGCPGYVKIGDSLREVEPGPVLFPQTEYDIWYTPFWFTETWSMRRAFYQTELLVRGCFSETPTEDVEETTPPAEVMFTEETKKTVCQQLNLFDTDYDDPDSIDELDG